MAIAVSSDKVADKRGLKRICTNCGTRFYDLNKRPVVCPSCDTEFTGDVKPKRRGRAAATDEGQVKKPKKSAEKVKDQIEDDDDEDEEDDDDDMVVSLDDVDEMDDDDDDDDELGNLDLDDDDDLDDLGLDDDDDTSLEDELEAEGPDGAVIDDDDDDR